MKSRFLVLVITTLFSFMVEAAHLESDIYGPYEIGDLKIQAKVLNSTGDLTEEETGSITTFTELYEPYSEEELGGKDFDKEKWLAGSFTDEKATLGTPGIKHVRLETVEGTLMGYFSVENWDLYEAKPVGMPEHSIYVRQFYLFPKYQGKGILKRVMPELLPILNPGVQHVYAATRRINEAAKKLYVGLGFKERVEALHGLSPEKYISYELHLGS